DLVVSADRPVRADVARADGVAVVAEAAPVPLDVALDRSNPSAYELADGLAVDPTEYLRTHRITATAGNPADLPGAAAAVSPGYSPGMGWKVGDTLRVKVGNEPRELRIVALLPDTLAGPFFLIPLDLAPQDGQRRYVVRVADGSDANAVAARLAS